MIPKKIHYCWFGNNKKPDEVIKCIDTFKMFNDYEIFEWNEFNVELNPYLENVLKKEKWANASNYTRLKVLRDNGGIYLDTDIEVLKDFTPLLNTDMFIGFQDKNLLNNAVLGATKDNKYIIELLNMFIEIFNGDERANISSPNFITYYFKNKFNLKYSSNPQKINEVSIYPEEYFYPHYYTEKLNKKKHIKNNTYTIHHWLKLW